MVVAVAAVLEGIIRRFPIIPIAGMDEYEYIDRLNLKYLCFYNTSSQ